MFEPDLKSILSIIMGTEVSGMKAKQASKHGGLIASLQEIQARYGYLPEDALRQLSKETGKSLTDIYGVATFYRSFSLKPRGKHLVSVCLGTACHVRGGPKIAEAFERALEVKAGETTKDREFTLETVNCVGACALSPIVVTDGRYNPRTKISSVKTILKKAQSPKEAVDVKNDRRVFPVEVSCAKCNHTFMDSEHVIDDLPAVFVNVSAGGSHGWLRLSSLFGSYKVESQHTIPPNEVTDFFCPHCHAQLIGGSPCIECGVSMVPMIVRGGGVVQICPKRGCQGHILDLVGHSHG
jgi:NADH:ubiquinone oxidoreductase subunit E